MARKKVVVVAAIAFGLLPVIFAGYASTLSGAAHDCTNTGQLDPDIPSNAGFIYACLSRGMYISYKGGDKLWVNKSIVDSYRLMHRVGNLPRKARFHSEDYLIEFTNVESDIENKYLEAPVGAIYVAESLIYSESERGRAGRLYIMERVETVVSPKSKGWLYTVVSPAGVPIAVDVWNDCNSCHSKIS